MVLPARDGVALRIGSAAQPILVVGVSPASSSGDLFVTANGARYVTGVRELADNQWHHIVVAFDLLAGRVTLYLDGAVQETE
jgi:hypothetical protein